MPLQREEMPDGSLKVTTKSGRVRVFSAESRKQAADQFRKIGQRSRGAKTQAKGRKDLSKGLAMVYGMVGGGLEVRGVHVTHPTDDGGAETVWQPSLAGRVMKVQSPMVGKVLSDAIRSSPFLYAVLGPVFGNEGVEVATRVIAPPLLVHMMQTRPHLQPMLEPLVIPVMADLFLELKRARAKAEEAMAELAEMDEDTRGEFDQFLGSVLGDVPSEPVEPVEVSRETVTDQEAEPSENGQVTGADEARARLGIAEE